MEVRMDSPNKLKKYKSTKKYISTKVLITQPFFELQTPDFAWKFIWTVHRFIKHKDTLDKKYKCTKIQKKRKMQKRRKHKKYKKAKKNLDTSC